MNGAPVEILRPPHERWALNPAIFDVNALGYEPPGLILRHCRSQDAIAADNTPPRNVGRRSERFNDGPSGSWLLS
jgi:hypothetical protein